MNLLTRPLHSILCGILLMIAPGCQQPEVTGDRDQPRHDADIQAITDMSNARAKAFNEGDSREIARYFSDEAYLMAPDGATKRGQDAVAAYYQSIFDEYDTELESGYEEVKVDGDLAYGRGFAKVTLHPKDGGETIHGESKYLNILERQEDGTWITTHDIWNDN
ncbi:YybH family protein [Pleomorphovibrio marinus]|uniref:YybH family protein n=1 Tax=Pleomorphovibrio marinus TaxID=2164132 RepID=UPI000E0A7763|nr:SgcJ/EcaC family oxidoreductase [Pleomorphovibrio marinus]